MLEVCLEPRHDSEKVIAGRCPSQPPTCTNRTASLGEDPDSALACWPSFLPTSLSSSLPRPSFPPNVHSVLGPEALKPQTLGTLCPLSSSSESSGSPRPGIHTPSPSMVLPFLALTPHSRGSFGFLALPRLFARPRSSSDTPGTLEKPPD